MACRPISSPSIPAKAAAAAQEPSKLPAEPLFSRHVVPLFSRLGCNAGACHGAVKGQNGFRLTLFGVDPALDHQRLVREFSSRRLNFQDPDGLPFYLAEPKAAA